MSIEAEDESPEDNNTKAYHFKQNDPVPVWLMSTELDVEEGNEGDSEYLCFGCNVIITVHGLDEEYPTAVIVPLGEGTEMIRVSVEIFKDEIIPYMSLGYIHAPNSDQVFGFDSLTLGHLFMNFFTTPLFMVRETIKRLFKRGFKINGQS